MESVLKKFPGREQICKYLWNVIREGNSSCTKPICQDLLLSGMSATGKTAILRSILDSKKLSYIFVDCYVCDDLSSLCTLILMELFKTDEEYFGSIRNFWDFITCFQRADTISRKLRFIVLKNCENLGIEIFEQFLTFRMYLNKEGWNLQMVFISKDNFIDTKVDISCIEFPQYSQDQLRSILLAERSNFPNELYHAFLSVFLPSVYNTQRDLRALLRLVDILFPIYKKPVDEGIICADNRSSLFRNICPYLQGNIDVLLLFPDRFLRKEFDDNKMFYSLDLPYCAKYLLLAAYMASFMPSKHDRLYFCQKSQKKKKKNTHCSASSTRVNILLGPKIFPINRLLAIYMAISGENSISAGMLSQVAYLVERRLLTVSGNSGRIELDNAKYKCVAPRDLINDVAKSLNFDLRKFEL